MHKLDILFQDEHLVLINKPSGLPVHQTIDPKRPSIESILKNQLQKNLYLAHRLDKDTTGVLLFTTNTQVLEKIKSAFNHRTIEKQYLCLVKFSQKIKPSFHVKNHLLLNKKTSPKKVCSTKSGGQVAETHFKVIKKIKDLCLIECTPVTGRTHQIRVHLAELGLPILGDNLYGGKSQIVPRLMLHAYKLKFPHPQGDKYLEITAPLPKDFCKIADL